MVQIRLILLDRLQVPAVGMAFAMKAKQIRLLLVCVALWLAYAPAAFGFSQGGHKVVALVAYSKLSPEARQKILGLLESHPRYDIDFTAVMPEQLSAGSATDRKRWIFAEASIWPDKPRGFSGEARTKYHRATWHYVNIPIFLTLDDKTALAAGVDVNLGKDWSADLDEGHLNAIQALDMIKKTFGTEGTDDAKRALMLCWAMHIIGDLHQPLHCATLFSRAHFERGDRGGNSLKAKTRRVGSVTNLHTLWDGLLGRDISFNTVQRRAAEALDDELILEAAHAGESVTNPWSWAEEGTKLAERYAYSEEVRAALAEQSGDEFEPVLLPPDYAPTAGSIIKERAAVAGFRLARFLDDLVAN